ncbi:MAG: hypothetical protein JXR83_13655, partial [Deltaproteobacteria bacterium]|nr:hypothetical protein [Deltaproteobacteria bacterium]
MMRVVSTSALLVAATVACQPAAHRCTTSAQCQPSEICFEGRCAATCASDADCSAQLSCFAGACLALGAPCQDSSDCLSIETCEDRVCRRLCLGGNDCSDGQVCQAGVCRPVGDAAIVDAARRDGTASDRPSADGATCTRQHCCVAADCGSGNWSCQPGGVCVCASPYVACDDDCRADNGCGGCQVLDGVPGTSCGSAG